MPPVRIGGRTVHRSHRLRRLAQPAERRRRRCAVPGQGNAGMARDDTFLAYKIKQYNVLYAGGWQWLTGENQFLPQPRSLS